MTEEVKEEAAAPAKPAKPPVPEFLPVRRVTATFIVPEATNWNDLKNWVKSCPFSQPGDQTLGWDVVQIPNPDYVKPDEQAQEG